MSDFLKYMHAQAEKDAAYQQYNYASQRLENKSIMCRFAEIQSQHEPLASIIGDSTTSREQLIAACHFVITGRLPEEFKKARQEIKESAPQPITNKWRGA
jgi:hypothetical protein